MRLFKGKAQGYPETSSRKFSSRKTVKYLAIFLFAYVASGFLFSLSKYSAKNSAFRSFYSPLSFIGIYPTGGVESKSAKSGLSIKVLKVEKQELLPFLETYGSISFYEKYEVTSKIGGRIRKIHVHEGDFVRRGAIIASLDPLPMKLDYRKQKSEVEASQARLELAKAALIEAEKKVHRQIRESEKAYFRAKQIQADWERQRENIRDQKILLQNKAISQDAYDEALSKFQSKTAELKAAQEDYKISRIGLRTKDLMTAGYKTPQNKEEERRLLVELNTEEARAQIHVARANLRAIQAGLESTSVLMKETNIVAPASGFIVSRNKSPGELVNPGANQQDSICTLVRTDKVYAVSSVTEENAQALIPDMPMEINLDAFPAKTYKGKLKIIYPISDDKSHTIEIRAMIQNKNYKLRPGLFFRGRIITGKAESRVVLPKEAILFEEESKGSVFAIREGKTYRTPVKIGQEYPNGFEVLKGVKPGDVIAVEKLQLLRDGLKVKPNFNDPG